MTFLQKPFRLEKKSVGWICSCRRKNDSTDTICGYCQQPKPEKAKSAGVNRLKSKANRTQYNGRSYDSGMEAEYAKILDFRIKAGDVTEWTPQFKIEIKVKGKRWRNYRVDFRVVLSTGTVQYHEVKGYATEEWKMKWDLLNIVKDEILEPGAELILVK